MIPCRIFRAWPAVVLAAPLFLLTSCAVPLGPGYTIEKQTLEVHFVAQPQPHLEIRAQYLLANSGNQQLSSFRVRIPSSKSYDVENLKVLLNGQEITTPRSTAAGDEELTIEVDPPWQPKQRRDLTILYEVGRSPVGPKTAPLAVGDAFYLPPGGWYPELAPPKGMFAKLDGPPKKWDFRVSVPQAFLVRASGHEHGSKKSAGETEHRFEQWTGDFLPFVIGGKYQQQEVRHQGQTVLFWLRQPPAREMTNQVGEKVANVAQFFDAAFGTRDKSPTPIWIVECPFAAVQTNWAKKDPPGLVDGFTVCGCLPDTAFLTVGFNDFAAEPRALQSWLIRSLAPSWFGYALVPERGGLPAPMDRLPDYAVAAAEESGQGPDIRKTGVASTLAQHDLEEHTKKKAGIGHAKSLLFFFALEDQYGREHLHHAIARMIHSRRGRGYDLNDLRSALEAETGQNAAPFFHRWLDNPGIPEDFRMRYAQPGSSSDSSKEKQP